MSLSATHLPAATRPWVPWQNGGGVTSLVAVHGTADAWEWRVSVARVAEAGPFSYFAGVDRILTVLSGDLELVTGQNPPRRLSEGEAIGFPGEVAVVGRPLGPTVTDLNVMVRRARWEARVRHISPVAEQTAILLSDTALLFFVSEGQVRLPDQALDVGKHDAVLVEGGRGAEVALRHSGAVHLIELSRRT